MTAFGFKFGKKPMDFSKMKGNLSPNGNGKAAPGPDEVKSAPVPANEPAPQQQKPEQKRGGGPGLSGDMKKDLPKILVLVLLALVFVAAIIFAFGPKLMPKLAAKAKKPAIVETAEEPIKKKQPVIAGLLEKLKLKKPQAKTEEELAPAEGEEMAAPEEIVSVRTYRVARSDFVDVLPAMGSVNGDKTVELRFSKDGVIDSINFFEGDLVRKGDIVATLDQKDELLELEHAKTRLKEKEAQEAVGKKRYETAQKLYDEGIIIKVKVEEAQLEHEAAKAATATMQKEVEFSLAKLDKTYLYSSLDGVMGTRDAEVGEYVTNNIKIATLYDTATVVTDVGIIEKDIGRIALGQNAKISVEAYPGVDFTGKIENISPIISGKSRTLNARIRLRNDNPKGTLLPGMFARVWISVYEKKNTIKVSSACLYDLNSDGEFDSVFTVGEDNIAKAVPVKVGYISTDYIEIVDGVREGEQIVSEAMAEIKDGSRVDVIEVQEPAF